jgi:protein phosphatase
MLEAFGVSDPGCVRQNNEDYYYVDPALGVYLLADGMGGAAAGETASRMAVETALKHIHAGKPRSAELLVRAFEAANTQVLSAANAKSELNGMGTTLVGAVENGNILLISSVGDSRAYLFENGQLIPITQDQTWVNEVGRKIGLDEEKLKAHPMRHVLTMAIGVDSTLRVGSFEIEPASGAEFLLCSDGLHGVLSQETIAGILRQDGSLEERCWGLIEAAKAAGGPDNVTVILLRKK